MSTNRYPLIADCAKCRDCKDPVHDFHAPTDLWSQVVGEEIVLCWDCFSDRANRLGIWRIAAVVMPMDEADRYIADNKDYFNGRESGKDDKP